MRKRLIEGSFCSLAVLILSVALYGCGNGTSGTTQKTNAEIAQSCSGCHRQQGSDWAKSAHSTKNGASCVDCHAPHPGHPNSCNVCHNGPASSSPRTVEIKNVAAVSGCPDLSASNMCLACHVGTVHGDAISSVADFSNAPFVRSQDATGGVTLYKKVGYHFYPDTSNKYNDADFYHHDEIGIGNLNGTGTLGPCVTCHVGQSGESGKRHFPFPIDSSRNLVSTVCAKCHTTLNAPEPMSTALLNNERNGYQAALIVLAKVLKDNVVVYRDAAPNFARTDWNAVFGGSGAQTMGAAFNFNLLWHDYGSYVHNRRYAKRLIFDSIDWMLDGAITGSIESPALPSSPGGELVFTKADGTGVYYSDAVKAEALSYLQGTTGERP